MPDRKAVALGYVAALAVVLITSVYPALTRLSVTTTLTPADILLLRLGVSGLLFAPYLVRHAHEIPRSDWLSALPLSFLHGWGMAGCVVFGLQFAPASHAAALGPGAIAAWIALIGFVLYRIEVDSKRLAGIAIIVVGVALILVASYRGQSLATAMIGDSMFLAASALGATYLVYIQRRRLDPAVAAAPGLRRIGDGGRPLALLLRYQCDLGRVVGRARVATVVPGRSLRLLRAFRAELRGARRRKSDRGRTVGTGAGGRRPLCVAHHSATGSPGFEWIAIISISAGVAVAFLPARGDRSVVAIRRVDVPEYSPMLDYCSRPVLAQLPASARKRHTRTGRDDAPFVHWTRLSGSCTLDGRRERRDDMLLS